MSDPVTLSTPVTRAGGEPIVAVTVRKPGVGALRGLKLLDVLQMDVNAMCKLLPRVTEPALLPDEVAALDPADFVALAGQTTGFFVSEKDKEALLANQ